MVNLPIRVERAAKLSAGAIVALTLGLFQLGQPSLWVDESFTARATGYPFARLSGENHWLYYTLVKTWTLIAGTGEWALRFPSVVGAVVAVVLLYLFGRRLLGPRAGLVASVLFAVNPFMVKWSQQARSYTWVAVLAIASTWLVLRARERDTNAGWLSYGLVLLLMIVWQAFSAFLLISVHAVVAWGNRRAIFTWAVVGAISVPWLAALAEREGNGGPTTWLERPDIEVIGLALRDAPGAFGVAAVVGICALAIDGRYRLLLSMWALLPFALSLVVSLYKPVFLDRYLIVSSPAFALLGAVALERLAGQLRIVAASALVVGTVAGLVLWYEPDGSDNWRGENWKAATAMTIRQGGGQVDPFWAEPAYQYYGGRLAHTGWILVWSEPGNEPADASKNLPYGKRLSLRDSR